MLGWDSPHSIYMIGSWPIERSIYPIEKKKTHIYYTFTILPSTTALLGFSPTSCSDGGGAQHIRWGSPHLSGLVFWVELGPRPYMLSAPVDLGYVERRLAVASPAGFKPAPRSRTRWTSPVLTCSSFFVAADGRWFNDNPARAAHSRRTPWWGPSWHVGFQVWRDLAGMRSWRGSSGYVSCVSCSSLEAQCEVYVCEHVFRQRPTQKSARLIFGLPLPSDLAPCWCVT